MHSIEPHFAWRGFYTAENDPNSPFFGKNYSEFTFTNSVYNHYIHPQWDYIGSPTLFMKLLYVNYNLGFCIIELIGEWNDCLNNDIMFFKRNIIDELIYNKINKFIIIGENILNFHYSDDCYYEEWFDDVEDGWISFVNFRPHITDEFTQANIDYYINWGAEFDEIKWRTLKPITLFDLINNKVMKRLTI